jgi:hypothetical protein
MPARTPPTLDQLVARQVRRWAQQQAQEDVPAPACVALSRLPSSGAAEIGLRVAEILSFQFFGIELVDRMAREGGVERHIVAGLDEHLRSGIDRWVKDGFRRSKYTESEYLRGLLHTLALLSGRGRAVLLGRGSAHVLPRESTLRVLLHAPRKFRIERLARSRNLGAREAEQQLESDEAERSRYLWHHFHVQPDDLSLYDLTLDTSDFGIEGSASLLVHAYRERFLKRRSTRLSRFSSAFGGTV